MWRAATTLHMNSPIRRATCCCAHALRALHTPRCSAHRGDGRRRQDRQTPPPPPPATYRHLPPRTGCHVGSPPHPTPAATPSPGTTLYYHICLLYHLHYLHLYRPPHSTTPPDYLPRDIHALMPACATPPAPCHSDPTPASLPIPSCIPPSPHTPSHLHLLCTHTHTPHPPLHTSVGPALPPIRSMKHLLTTQKRKISV